jgi:hypothetical protein
MTYLRGRHESVRTSLLTKAFVILLICVGILYGAPLRAAPVAVRYKLGLLHGLLVLSTLDGTPIAEGDLTQVPHGDRITSRMTFHFKDGSLQDETTVFSQGGNFRLISYHLVQKGPSFPHPVDVSIAASTGHVTVQYTDNDGKQKVADEHLKLPPDLANGLVPTLLENTRPDTPQIELPMVVATPKPRIVKLVISPQGNEPFTLAGSGREAIHYLVKIDLGGIAAAVAPIIGKQPPDMHIWILGGDAPVFVKSESLSYSGGPIWRTEQVAPVWPRSVASDAKGGSGEKH